MQEESDDEEEEEAKPVAKKAKTAATPAAAPAAEEEDDGNVGIFIKNLPWKVTEDDVAEFFADAGEVVNVRLGETPLPLQGCRALLLIEVQADFVGAFLPWQDWTSVDLLHLFEERVLPGRS